MQTVSSIRTHMTFKPILVGLLGLVAWPAQAQERIALAGVEAGRDNRYAYFGTLLPVPGQRLGQGFVQRYWLDYIAYRYEKASQQDIDARVAGVEAALGYQRSDAAGWWGGYLGARYAGTRLSPGDADNDGEGRRVRAKLQFEGEIQATAGWRINGIVSHLVGDDNYWLRLRAQTVLGNAWHIGPEMVAQGDSTYRLYKLGAFLGNIRLGADSALTLKAGASKPENDPASLYAGAEFYIPF